MRTGHIHGLLYTNMKTVVQVIVECKVLELKTVQGDDFSADDSRALIQNKGRRVTCCVADLSRFGQLFPTFE